jgi:UDPglucose 6-dehydrogenase
VSKKSINDPNYVNEFKIEDAVVGQIGYGFIGNAVVELFRPFAKTVLVYDKAKCADIQPGRNRQAFDNVFLYGSVDDVVKSANVIFTAVPTPMRKSGECDTSIIESVIQDVQNAAMRLARNLEEFILVVKSTVPPGFTKRMQDKYALRLMFSPEFLTEANAVNDFKRANRVLLGGDVEDARVVFKYFEGVWPGRVMGPSFDPAHPDGPVAIIQCDSSVAEMVKLSTNVHLTAKVMISNELYLICQKLGIPYDDVKLLTQFDRRIGTSHMNVPGPDGHLGYGGHCFVKDTQSLGFIAGQLQTCDTYHPGMDNSSLFRALHKRNLEIREDRDWEAQKGRAVSDE